MSTTDPPERREPPYDLTIRVVTAILFLLMIVITCAGVFARYVLNDSLVWADTLSLWLFVWLTFLGAAIAVRRGAHMAMDVVREVLPTRLRLADAVMAELAVIGASGFLILSGIALVETSGGTVASATGLRVGWAMLAIPVGGVLMTIEALRRLVIIVRARRANPSTDHDAVGTALPEDDSPDQDGGGQ